MIGVEMRLPRPPILLLVLVTTPLGAAKKLEVQQARIQQLDDGPDVPSGFAFQPGETVFFSCLIDGYRLSAEKRVLLKYEAQALDPLNVALAEPVRDKVDSELREEDKEWKPKIRYEVLVPPFAPSGVYRIRLSARDELAQSALDKEVTFTVRGHDVAPSATVAARNFGFYRGEEEAQPLRVAAYRPGDVVWARFDLIGYKFGPGNQLHVSYSVTVNAPGGRVLFQQPEPTVEQSGSFYPKRYVPCMINLNLDRNISPGEYAVRVSVMDRVGDQKHEITERFRVE
jgi:hypothetical protein